MMASCTSLDEGLVLPGGLFPEPTVGDKGVFGGMLFIAEARALLLCGLRAERVEQQGVL